MFHVAMNINICRSEAGITSANINSGFDGLAPDFQGVGKKIVENLKDEVSHLSPRDSWFSAYLKGNLLMPQTYDAGAIFLANVVLKHGGLDHLKSASCLSPVQLARARRAMEGAHRVRRIPAGDSGYLQAAKTLGGWDMSRSIIVDDEKLFHIWNRFRERAVIVSEALMKRRNGLSIAEKLVENFQAKDCRDLLRSFREQYDRRKDGSEKKAILLRRRIQVYVVSQVPPPCEGLFEEIFGS